MEPYALPNDVDTKPSAARVLAKPNAKDTALLHTRAVNGVLQNITICIQPLP